MPSVEIRVGDCLELLRAMPPESVHCVVTSPPYYGLRDYGMAGQIGLEESPQAFLAKLVEVFAEVRRVLRKDGTCWVNMGDSYCGARAGEQGCSGAMANRTVASARCRVRNASSGIGAGMKPKDMMGMPWRLAFALQDDGWWLRQDIIWSKPNPMPESTKDRCTKSHEYLFLLTRSRSYYFDAAAIAEPVSGTAHARGNGVNPKARGVGWGYVGDEKPRTIGKGVTGWAATGAKKTVDHNKGPRSKQNASFSGSVCDLVDVRSKRSVWTVPTFACPDAHFATYPPDLIKPCILAGSPGGGIVLDPFGGSGTTGMVALELGRSAVLLELNPEYAAIAERRCCVTPGLPFGNAERTEVRGPITAAEMEEGGGA